MSETTRKTVSAEPEALVQEVRERYGRIARGTESGCCGPTAAERAAAPGSASASDASVQGAGATAGSSLPNCCPETDVSLRVGYGDADLAAVPEGANLGVGCGAPIAFLEPVAGETVLDLGSGGGLDVFLAARRVGSTGHVIGVDMTPEMIERARKNAAEGGFTQVEFRLGRLEALPVENASVDAVTSNCVINLVPDKLAVFREIARVLKPGGRLVISDVLLDGRLPEVIESDLLAYVGCVAGAIDRRAYFALVEAAGLSDIAVLKDVDSLATWGYTLGDELIDRMKQSGVTLDQLAGKVRSVTFRAFKK
jgi:SAM-dependent methyltransferase